MLDYNLLFRWFLDMSLEQPGLDQSNFSRLRERLVDQDTTRVFFDAVVRQAREAGLLSDEHFTVDGTLIEAWASPKSFKPKDGPPSAGDGSDGMVDFRGQRRSNDTHKSTTDEEAKLARKGKGKEAKLSYGGHALMENRNGLCVDLAVCSARPDRDRGGQAAAGAPSAGLRRLRPPVASSLPPCRGPARQSLLTPLSDGGRRASAMVALDDDLAGDRLAAPAGVRHAQALAYLREGLRPQGHALTDLAVGHGVADTHVHRCSAKWRVYAA